MALSVSLHLFICCYVIQLQQRKVEGGGGCICGDEGVVSPQLSRVWILRLRYRTWGLVVKVKMEMRSYSNGFKIACLRLYESQEARGRH